ncbi:MAG TPA: urate hydroxylase PuuD [Candidatus Rubrimentiphilum sp.]|nr:urate hydroxylase PuuD [Candidatus Rubrimentiphilum sp.]
MGAYGLSWLDLVVRWFHFVAGISWIGTSLYFVWLDDRLMRPRNSADLSRGVSGELWSVHGGGFYHNQKYLTGPIGEPLPQTLHWFQWEAYSTWLSGIGLMAIVYWAGASNYLIDRSVLPLGPAAGIALSIGTIVIGYVIYDLLCRVLERSPFVLGASVFIFLTLATWGLFHLFSARAAYIHAGAIIGTIMAANVAHVIIPGQRKMVAAIRAGQAPDQRPGQLAKIRSVHNTYFTLPVLFIMISAHYPMAYQNPYGWLILAGISLAGVLVRYFFILSHQDKLVWAYPIAAFVILAAIAIAILPRSNAAAGVSFAQVQPIFARRCATCHAAHPSQPGYIIAPAGVLLDTPEHIQANAQRIYQQAVVTTAMPLGNITGMTSSERRLIGGWIAAGAK